ncbi:CYTH domain-containing protein [Nitrospirillum sp. BR 11828]|uniref:CYTH and CHAD domain-containing protein n=1 Tax=Nitrospirillum sp. BR 11828 TaxID=3104325 RepID=UPI002ACACC6F|nr:CYTH domain-containing protein [Nitrospirillum sp. BR 11828]MDZ5649701.1 CYTH domain-containing protein [Nitrospirillum sp. BR 11828]
MTNGPDRPTPVPSGSPPSGPDAPAEAVGGVATPSVAMPPAALEPDPAQPPAPPSGSRPKRALAVREVEVKLATTPAALERLQALPLLARMADGPAVHRHQVTTYYDTPDLALAARGLALRVRRQGGRRVQTVKTWASDAGTAAAAGRREWEWELPADGDGPDRTLLPATIAGLLNEEQWAQVAARFATDIHRTALLLHPDPRTSVELALDQGEVRLSVPGASDETTWPVAEVELELKGGRVAALFEVAAALHHHAPLRLTTGSKADAGLRLLTGKPAAAVPAHPAALTPVTTVAEGFRHATRQAVGHLLENATVLLESGDPQALREMAAASRRLDTALRLLRVVIGLTPAAGLAWSKATANPHADMADALRRRLIPLRTLLETARAWDRLAERAALLPDRKGAAGLSKRQRLALDHAANQGRRRVMKHLRGASHTALMLDLAAWIEGGGWASPALDQPLRTVAPRLLADLQDKVAKALARLDLPPPPSPGAKAVAPGQKTPPDTDALERLRRRAQRLYETAEVCRGLYPVTAAKPKGAKTGAKAAAGKRPAADPLAPLTRLHAAVTTPALARQAAQLVAQLTKATGPKARSTRLLSRLAQEEAVALAKLPATWRGYSRRRMFWIVGR